MTALRDGIRKLAADAGEQAREYAAGEDRPMRGYALTMSTYAGLVGALAAAARISGRPVPEDLAARDIIVIGAATARCWSRPPSHDCRE